MSFGSQKIPFQRNNEISMTGSKCPLQTSKKYFQIELRMFPFKKIRKIERLTWNFFFGKMDEIRNAHFFRK